tara:strand:+ start:157 stop:402 length:246 start_codon:yes stop_codon:yes gene_type:complete
MSWKDIVKESRLEKLRAVLRKYYDDNYVNWITENTTEDSVDEYIKWEIGELKANIRTVPKTSADDKYKTEVKSLINELEKI